MPTEIFPYIGAFIVGFGKAGFASGISLLQTPLIAYAVPARAAIGIVLPLLIFADLLAVGAFWRKWDFSLIKWPLIGCVPGIAFGILFVDAVSDSLLRRSLGILALFLTTLLIIRDIWHPSKKWDPSWWQGAAVGAFAGFCSTVAHAAGPIMALYFVAQKLEKRVFVASSALFFFATNWMKLPPYVYKGVVDGPILLAAAKLAPMVPLGVGVGWVLNRYIPQKYFVYAVYVLLFVAGLDLTFR
ncbi:MAG TPA: sulfite exporter TauE/SafE family protein [Fibrobacteria bacterium]|jgi:hypothetical protein|nr:sulfite exporter TauE/SafE family protein [Fibrobacteria bacterium]